MNEGSYVLLFSATISGRFGKLYLLKRRWCTVAGCGGGGLGWIGDAAGIASGVKFRETQDEAGEDAYRSVIGGGVVDGPPYCTRDEDVSPGIIANALISIV